jgi:hypothetical protein
MRPGITSLLSVLMLSLCPPLTDNAKYIDSGPCFLFPQQVYPVPLDVLPSPLSSCLQKQEIVQNDTAIVAPLVASVGAAATLMQDMCVSPMAPSFSMACCRSNLSPGRNRISIAFGNDGKLDLSLGLVREEE